MQKIRAQKAAERGNGQSDGASKSKRRKKDEKREVERMRAEKKSRKDAEDPDESILKLRKRRQFLL